MRELVKLKAIEMSNASSASSKDFMLQIVQKVILKLTRKEKLLRPHGVKMMNLVIRRAQVMSLQVKKS